MSYRERALNWIERAENEEDEFIKFILYYISFEVLCKLRGIGKREVKNNDDIRESVTRKIDDDRFLELINLLERKPLKNLNPNGDHRWNGKIESKNDINGIVEFIIRSRNNLFHGDKGLEEGRDIIIVNWGIFLIKPIIQEMIE